jgi:hypothetical protein
LFENFDGVFDPLQVQPVVTDPVRLVLVDRFVGGAALAPLAVFAERGFGAFG